MAESSRLVVPLGSSVYFLQAFRLIGSPGLRTYVWGPLLVNVILYSLGTWLAFHYFSAVLDSLIPGWLDWLRWLIWPVFALMLSAIAFFTFTLVANLIGSPFYGVLAERALASALPGGEYSRHLPQGLVKDIMASVISEGHRLVYFAIRGIPLLLLFVIPVVNMAAPVLWLVFGAWSLSLEYMSYPLEAKGLNFEDQRLLARKNRLDALTFGCLIMLGLAVPVLNVLVPPAAVIAASLSVANRHRQPG